MGRGARGESAIDGRRGRDGDGGAAAYKERKGTDLHIYDGVGR